MRLRADAVMRGRRSAEELAKEKPYMVFDFVRGYVFGPGADRPGELPYWNTWRPAERGGRTESRS